MAETNVSHLVEALHPLEKQLMRVFAEHDHCNPHLLEDVSELKPAQISSAIEWLLVKKIIVLSEENVKLIASLTEIGERYAEAKNPPLRMAEEIMAKGEVSIRELQQRTDMEPEEKSKAIGALKSSGAVSVVAGGRFKISDEAPLSVFRDLQNVIDGLKKKESHCLFSEFSEAEQAIIETHIIGNAVPQKVSFVWMKKFPASTKKQIYLNPFLSRSFPKKLLKP